METWLEHRPAWAKEQEQTDERNPDESPPSQATSACTNPGERIGDNHLAFPVAWDEE